METMYTFTGVTDAGNAFVDAVVPQYSELALNHSKASLNHYVKTGEKLMR